MRKKCRSPSLRPPRTDSLGRPALGWLQRDRRRREDVEIGRIALDMACQNQRVPGEWYITTSVPRNVNNQFFDGLIGPFNPYLYSPITPGFLQWMQADGKYTSLSKRVHEVVILSVGAVWQSPYEMYAHSAVARTVGVPEAAIEALVKGGSSDVLTSEEDLAHRFARQLTLNRKVETELYREAEAAFGRTALVDMVYLVGMYLLTCALLNTFEVPVPE